MHVERTHVVSANKYKRTHTHITTVSVQKLVRKLFALDTHARVQRRISAATKAAHEKFANMLHVSVRVQL